MYKKSRPYSYIKNSYGYRKGRYSWDLKSFVIVFIICSIPFVYVKLTSNVNPSVSLAMPEPYECPNGCVNHPSGCDIKGNVSFNGGSKIYHLPGWRDYNATVINPKYGERWFCSEVEAVANGWRKPYVR